jgi:hypothetical protein
MALFRAWRHCTELGETSCEENDLSYPWTSPASSSTSCLVSCNRVGSAAGLNQQQSFRSCKALGHGYRLIVRARDHSRRMRVSGWTSNGPCTRPWRGGMGFHAPLSVDLTHAGTVIQAALAGRLHRIFDGLIIELTSPKHRRSLSPDIGGSIGWKCLRR